MSHYKPYPAYKDSGVEWIGRVPEHWEVKRFKFAISTCRNGIWGDDPTGHDDTPCVRVADFDRSALRVNQEIPTLRAIPERDRASRLLRPGNLLLEKSGGGDSQPVGQVVLYDQAVEAVCSNFIARMELVHRADPSFWCYQFAGAYACGLNLRSVKQTSGIQNLDQEQYLDEMATCPPHAEQSAIAAALDRETARIDALIAKKTRFIELLKEKRQALITHAVTKGLDPNVKMKDSGVAWIGQVPEHWDIVPSTWLFVESNERAHADDEHLSATQKYGVIPLAEYERLEGRQLTHAVKNLEQRKHVEIDNFVISMRSFEGGIERVRARGCVRSSYVVLLAEPGADVGFFAYLLKSSSYIQGLQATSSFVRDGQDLSYANFRQVKMPAPNIAEQKAIAAHLDRGVSRIDALAAKTERSIALLKERRSALITAAVTGQIDLREEVA